MFVAESTKIAFCAVRSFAAVLTGYSSRLRKGG